MTLAQTLNFIAMKKTLFPLERKQVSAQEIQLDVMGNGFSSESTDPEMLT